MDGLDEKSLQTHDLAIIGMGYVGLPLAEAATLAGLHVVGFDVSKRVVQDLNAGSSHVDDISDERLADMRTAGFSASDDPSVIATASVVVICVPTPLATDGSPDLGAVLGAATVVATHMAPGTLVVLESTTYPGTTEEVLLPLLSRYGGIVGQDFFLAFSPERVDPGNKLYTITNTPKVVGAVTPGCLAAATNFYGRFIDKVVAARGTREAETAKLLENTYRHINIALANEMARVCHVMGIDIWDVITCAATKPFGFEAFWPGPGVGGHCIPIDPNYLSYAVKKQLGYPLRFVELAQDINRSMPEYVTQRVQDTLNLDAKAIRGSRILLVGVTYKSDVADQRESPARALAVRLRGLGAELRYCDPYVDTWAVDGIEIPPLDADNARSCFDLVVFLQHHERVDRRRMVSLGVRVLDTRGQLAGAGIERL